jgi:hypothetical protein
VTLLEGADAGPVPAVVTAETVNVYAVPLVRPVTVIGLPGPDAVTPSGFDVILYADIGLPPSLVGGVKAIVARALPAVALTFCGAPGRAACGVTAFDVADAGPAPALFVAVTVNV